MKRNIDVFFDTSIQDRLQDINNKLVSGDLVNHICLLDLISDCGEVYGGCFLNKPQDCSQCLQNYFNMPQGTYPTRLVMWHISLISVLPTKLLDKQFFDCLEISRYFRTGHKLNNLLVQKVFDYDKRDFINYCGNVLLQMRKLGVAPDVHFQLELSKNLGCTFDDNIYSTDIFTNWHNDKYLFNNIMNIAAICRQNKITASVWLEIYNKFSNFLSDYEYKKADLH